MHNESRLFPFDIPHIFNHTNDWKLLFEKENYECI